MEIAYFDTSALVKRYVSEVGSNWVNNLLNPSNHLILFTSHLTVVEATCAFSRRLRERAISQNDYQTLRSALNYDITYEYIVVDIMQVTIGKACQLAANHPLRAYDAIHLSTALLLNNELIENRKSPLTFICADNRLISIAEAENLSTDNPNHH